MCLHLYECRADHSFPRRTVQRHGRWTMADLLQEDVPSTAPISSNSRGLRFKSHLPSQSSLSLVSNRTLCHCDAFAPLPNPTLIFHALLQSHMFPALRHAIKAEREHRRLELRPLSTQRPRHPATRDDNDKTLNQGGVHRTYQRRSLSDEKKKKEGGEKGKGTEQSWNQSLVPRYSLDIQYVLSLTRRDATWSRRPNRPKRAKPQSRLSTPSKYQARHLRREQKEENGTRSTANSPTGTQTHAQSQARLLHLPQLQHAHLEDAMATPPV